MYSLGKSIDKLLFYDRLREKFIREYEALINKFATVNFTLWFTLLIVFMSLLIIEGLALAAWPAFIVLFTLFGVIMWSRGGKPVKLTRQLLILNRFPLQNRIPLDDIASFHLSKRAVAVVYKNGIVRKFSYLIGPVNANLNDYRGHCKFMDKSIKHS